VKSLRREYWSGRFRAGTVRAIAFLGYVLTGFKHAPSETTGMALEGPVRLTTVDDVFELDSASHGALGALGFHRG
jgi:hypothetical protein